MRSSTKVFERLIGVVAIGVALNAPVARAHDWLGYSDPPDEPDEQLTWSDVVEDVTDYDGPISNPVSWDFDFEPGASEDVWTPDGGLFLPPQSAIPEPASVFTLLVGAGFLVARRRPRR